MPIDLTISTAANSVTHTVWNDQEQQWYLIPAEGPVTQLEFDEDYWILRGIVQLVGYVEPEVQCTRPLVDPDGDGDADQDDFALYQTCLTGSGVYVAGEEIFRCQCLDLDHDRDVDGRDLGLFRACMTGQGIALTPDCAL